MWGLCGLGWPVGGRVCAHVRRGGGVCSAVKACAAHCWPRYDTGDLCWYRLTRADLGTPVDASPRLDPRKVLEEVLDSGQAF